MMFTGKDTIETLKSDLFDLLSLVSSKPYEELLLKMTKIIKNTLNADDVIFCLYENWLSENKLKLYGDDTEMISVCLTDAYYESDLKEDLLHKEIMYLESFSEKVSYALKINSSFEPGGFAVISSKHYLDEELLKQVRDMLSKTVNVMNSCLYSSYDKKRNEVLLDLSSQLYALYKTRDIFQIVVNTLNTLYPHFSHHFLLSQDYDQISTLPIKTIEYGKSAELTAGTRAFINGELEIESNIETDELHIYTPLNGKQGVYGVLQMTTPIELNNLEWEISFLKKIALIIGQSIERTSLYQSSNRLVTDLQTINEASHKLNSNLEQGEIIDTVKKQIIDTCYATEVGFLTFKNKRGKDCLIDGQSTSFFLDKNNKDAMKIIISKIEKRDMSMFYGNFKSVNQAFPFESIMFIPMKMSDYEYGMTIVMNEAKYHFSFEKFKFIESLVQHATLALMNTSLKEDLKRSVITDYLTKIYSRNYLDEKVAQHMSKDDKGTLILFDIDDFKNINDTYGHAVGDKVLIQVADVLTEETIENGFAARWGGEEFAVYIPHKSLNDGIDLANIIREKAKEVTYPKITLSSGVAYWTRDKSDSVKDVFIRADKALYQAKTSGKNKVKSEL